MPFLNSVRDAVIQGQQLNRDDGKIRPGTRWQKEPLKDGCSRADNGCARNSTREYRTKVQDGSYI
jgi:hypothetical protein